MIRNARIQSADIVTGSGGRLSAWLELDYGNGEIQGFGGYELEPTAGPPIPFLRKCMEIAGVGRWKDLPGQIVRVDVDEKADRIECIGHILENIWFRPAGESVPRDRC